MTTLGIKPGDAVLVIEHRGEQQLVYNALVARISMDDKLAGTLGEPAIEAVFLAIHSDVLYKETGRPTLNVWDVVHISHRDFIEGRSALGYEEMPMQPGVCRYCKCSDRRPCAAGCRWLDDTRTVCNTDACVRQFEIDLTIAIAGFDGRALPNGEA